MSAALLFLDNALTPQWRLRQEVCDGGGRILDYRDLGPMLRLWSRPAELERLKKRLAVALPASFGPATVFCGSGDFHHITPLLLERAMEASGRHEVTVVHFDNHPDWVCFGPGAHCGSWVGIAARLPGVTRIITVGVCSSDIEQPESKNADLSLVEEGRVELYAYRSPGGSPNIQLRGSDWPTIESMGEEAFAQFLPSRIQTGAVYVTIDKDVLCPEDAGTNWDQGRMRLGFLQTLIDRVARGRRLIGADVLGDWSRAVYGGDLAARLLKSGEAMLDQPWKAPSEGQCAGNEAVNLALLTQLRELVS